MSTRTSPTAHPSGRRRAQWREARERLVRQERQQPLPGWLAGRTARRVLALSPLVVFALGVAAAVAGGGFTTAVIGVATSLVASGAVVQLRRVTRMLDNAPEHLLDEREIGEREVAHRRGHRLAVVLLGALFALAVLNGLLAQEARVELVDSVGWMVLLFASLLSAGMLPAAAAAWAWREPVDEADDVDEVDEFER